MSDSVDFSYTPCVVPALSDAFYAYNPETVNYAALKVAPFLRVGSKNAYVEAVSPGSLQDDSSLVRKPGAAFAESNLAVDRIVYALSNKGTEHLSPNDEYDLVQVNRDKAAIRILKSRLLNDLEAELATALGDSTAVTFTDSWLDATTDIFAAIELGNAQVAEVTGANPNTLVLSNTMYRVMIANPFIIKRFGAAVLTKEAFQASLASTLGLDKIVISSAVSNGAPIIGNDEVYVCVSANDTSGMDASEASWARTLGVAQSTNADGTINPYAIVNYMYQPKNSLVYQLQAAVGVVKFNIDLCAAIPTNIS